MASRNLLKLCTAAFAGSLIGIVYELNRNKLNTKELQTFFEKQGFTRSEEISELFKDQHGIHIDFLETVTKMFIPLAEAKTQTKHNEDILTLTKSQDSIAFERKDLPPVDPNVSVKNFKLASQYGLPSKDNLRVFNDFILSYDRRLRSPIWVLEHLTPEKLKGPASRDKVTFGQDKVLHPYFRANDADYRGSGLDRGHMAAAGNHKSSQDNLEQTFYYSNIIPQAPVFNREGWNKLEKYVRWRTNKCKNVYVVTGPLYLPTRDSDGKLYVTYRVIGNTQVAVPTHLYKIILYESKNGDLSLEAFLMSNQDALNSKIKLNDYRVSIGDLNIIERAAGVIFFDQINRDNLRQLDLLSGFKD